MSEYLVVDSQVKDSLPVHEYGAGPGTVITLHGGPSAAGDLTSLATELGRKWRVLEPFQRGSGGDALTVATHVQDLDDLICVRYRRSRPVLVGHSWGAMLALAYAAAYPESPLALVLIGCGTFSRRARAEFVGRREARTSPADRAEIAEIQRNEPDPDQRLAAIGRVFNRVYGRDIDESLGSSPKAVDAVAHEQTWSDMVRLQNDGTYPSAFGAIRVPVLMLHGEDDPHPGRLTYDDLKVHMPQLEYRELSACGHSPWLERCARKVFFDCLHAWIAARFSGVTQ